MLLRNPRDDELEKYGRLAARRVPHPDLGLGVYGRLAVGGLHLGAGPVVVEAEGGVLLGPRLAALLTLVIQTHGVRLGHVHKHVLEHLV